MALKNLSYSTKISKEILDQKKEIIAFYAFSNFSKYFPLMNNIQKSQLLNDLLKERVLLFIPQMDITNCEIFFPEEFKNLIFKNLESVILDDYNLNQFFSFEEYETFRRISSLTIFSETKMLFEGEFCLRFKYLKNLTLVNKTKRMMPFPLKNIPKLLDKFEICGYRICFEGRLPRELLLEDCFVKDSSKLPGCEKMSIFNTYWEEPSPPIGELYLENTTFRGDVETLEILHSNDSTISINIEKNKKLKDLRLTRTIVENFTILSESTEKLTIDLETLRNKFSSLKQYKNTKELNFRFDICDAINLDFFPMNLQKICFSNSRFSIEKIIEILGKIPNDISVRFTYCNFSDEEKFKVHKIVKIPKNFLKLEIISSNINQESSSIELIPEKLKEPEILISETEKITCKNAIITKTNVYWMEKNDFIKFCNKKSKSRGIFTECFVFLKDIILLTIYDQKFKEYLTIFSSFPYSVIGPTYQSEFEIFEKYLHDDSDVSFYGQIFKKKNLTDGTIKLPSEFFLNEAN